MSDVAVFGTATHNSMYSQSGQNQPCLRSDRAATDVCRAGVPPTLFLASAELQGVPNVILTPHIGGSTEEAQAAIGREVALALVKYVSTGSTAGAVNFPQASCQALTSGRCLTHRLDAASFAADRVSVI